jgi:hypothetical protein
LPRLLTSGTRKYPMLMDLPGVFVGDGVTVSCMNFSLDVFVGGWVRAGVVGWTVTYCQGAAGKRGTDQMQTAAVWEIGPSGIGVLIWATVWLGSPQSLAWQPLLYVRCIDLVDRRASITGAAVVGDTARRQQRSRQ